MKRLLVMSLLVVVALAMTVGTAYASACGGSCAGTKSCDAMASRACPMSAPSVLGPSCPRPDQRQAREASVPQPSPEASVLSATPQVRTPCTCSFAPTSLTPDARGAPHLIVVLRI